MAFSLSQIVNFHQSNANGVVYTTHDRSVVTRLQRRDDRRLAWLSRSMPAALDRVNLVAGDNLVDSVHLHERNACGVVYPAHDGGVITR